MIRGYRYGADRLEPVADPLDAVDGIVWYDLVDVTADEEAALERILGIDVPTRAEAAEIEITSRLYVEDGACFITVPLPGGFEKDDVVFEPVTFILTGRALITVRYHEPLSFTRFAARVQRSAAGCDTAVGVLLSLLDAVVDRLADILEQVGANVERISGRIFRRKGAPRLRGNAFEEVLDEIGANDDLASNLRESLVIVERGVNFLAQYLQERNIAKNERTHLKMISRDAHYLAEHTTFLSQKTTFLLDATLGLINIEQTGIINIFSVAAVIFLPPTVIASIYGMNFEHMPELGWRFGYPLSLVLMVLSAVLPFLFFKYKKWL